MLAVAAAGAAASPKIGAIVVAAPPGYEEEARSCVEGLPVPTTVLTGGRTRQASVRAALAALAADAEIVVVHDAARPFAPPDLFTDVIRAVEGGADGAVPVIAVADTVKRLDGVRVVDTVARNELGLAQTPQAFRCAGAARSTRPRVRRRGEGDRRRDAAGADGDGRRRGRRPEELQDHDDARPRASGGTDGWRACLRRGFRAAASVSTSIGSQPVASCGSAGCGSMARTA